MSAIDAYPLCWPTGWKRFASSMRIRARFSKKGYAQPNSSWRPSQDLTVSDGAQRVIKALAAFGVQDGDAIISTNVRPRLDGLPRSGEREPDDPGVAVYWERHGENGQKVMAIDIYDRVADNLAAIAATLEAMRAIERHGGAAILDRAFTGFVALAGPDSPRPWRETLGDDIKTREQLEARYKVMRSQHHPDRQTGSAEMFDRVQKAYAQAQQELGA